MPPVEKKVILVIADISGYTSFMTKNRMELIHSQHLIGELLKAIIREVDIPLQVAEIEGDAVFMYALRPNSQAKWQKAKEQISNKLVSFILAFSRKLDYLTGSNTCHCGACGSLEQLKLKVVVHAGEAVLGKIANFTTLHGLDTILVHSLLKNSVDAAQYIMLTKAAQQELGFQTGGPFREGSEEYPDLGKVETLVWTDPLEGIASGEKITKPAYGILDKTKRKIGLMAATMALGLKLKKTGRFRNLPPGD